MSAELGQVVEKTTIHGQVEIATYPWTPDLEGLDDHEVFKLLQDREATDRRKNHNIMCIAGLNVLIASVMWAAMQHQNQNMGDPFSLALMTPIICDVGDGTVAPLDTDTSLYDTWGMQQPNVLQASLMTASAGNDGFITWSFLFGIVANFPDFSPLPVAEVGVFVNAKSVSVGPGVDENIVADLC